MCPTDAAVNWGIVGQRWVLIVAELGVTQIPAD